MSEDYVVAIMAAILSTSAFTHPADAVNEARNLLRETRDQMRGKPLRRIETKAAS